MLHLVSGTNPLSFRQSLWFQLRHFLLTYSFTHHFFLFCFTTLLIHSCLPLSITPGLKPTCFINPTPSPKSPLHLSRTAFTIGGGIFTYLLQYNLSGTCCCHGIECIRSLKMATAVRLVERVEYVVAEMYILTQWEHQIVHILLTLVILHSLIVTEVKYCLHKVDIDKSRQTIYNVCYVFWVP